MTPPLAEDRLAVRRLGVMVTEHCGLACYGCDTASPARAPRLAGVAQVRADLDTLARVLYASELRLTGGEPTLHPELVEIARHVRSAGISQQVVLATHGPRIEDLPAALWRCIDRVVVSVYPGVVDQPEREQLRLLAARYGFAWERRSISYFSLRLLNRENADRDLVRRIYATCWLRNEEHTLYDGRYYKCGVAASMSAWLGACGRCVTPDLEDSVSLRAADLKTALRGYLMREEPLSACRFCLGSVGVGLAHRQMAQAALAAWLAEDHRDVARLVDPAALARIEAQIYRDHTGLQSHRALDALVASANTPSMVPGAQIADDPTLTAAELRLGELELRLGDRARAERAFRGILAREPHNAWAEAGLAECLLDHGRIEDAVHLLRRLTRAHPELAPPQTLWRRLDLGAHAPHVLVAVDADAQSLWYEALRRAGLHPTILNEAVLEAMTAADGARSERTLERYLEVTQPQGMVLGAHHPHAAALNAWASRCKTPCLLAGRDAPRPGAALSMEQASRTSHREANRLAQSLADALRSATASSRPVADPAPPASPLLSVVVATRDRPEKLANLIDALELQTLDPRLFELVVVDDGSEESLAAWLGDRRPPFACTLVRQERLGLGAARRRSVEAARGTWLVFVNDDTLPNRDNLMSHLRLQARSRHPVAVLGSFEFLPELRRSALTDSMQQHLFLFSFAAMTPGEEYDWRAFATCNTSIRRDLVLSAGNFSRDYASSCEDAELGYRLERCLGVRVRYEPQIQAYHDHAIAFDHLVRRSSALGEALYRMWSKHRDPSILVMHGTERADEPFWMNERLEAERFARRRSRLLAQARRAAARTVTSGLDTGERLHAVAGLFARIQPFLIGETKRATVCAHARARAWSALRQGEAGINTELPPNAPSRGRDGVRQPEWSVVLLAKGGGRSLAATLRTLVRQHPAPREILVIDAGVSEAARTHIDRAIGASGNGRVRWVASRSAEAPLASASRALETCAGELVMLAHAGARFMPGTLRRLGSHFDAWPDVGLVGPVFDTPWGAEQTASGLTCSFDPPRESVSFVMRHRHEARFALVLAPAVVAIRTDVVRVLGGLAKDFSRARFAVADLCLRAREAGYLARIAGDCPVRLEPSLDEALRARDRQAAEVFATRWRDPSKASVDYDPLLIDGDAARGYADRVARLVRGSRPARGATTKCARRLAATEPAWAARGDDGRAPSPAGGARGETPEQRERDAVPVATAVVSGDIAHLTALLVTEDADECAAPLRGACGQLRAAGWRVVVVDGALLRLLAPVATRRDETLAQVVAALSPHLLLAGEGEMARRAAAVTTAAFPSLRVLDGLRLDDGGLGSLLRKPATPGSTSAVLVAPAATPPWSHPPLVSVIAPARGRAREQACLRDFLDWQDLPPFLYEVIAVDGDSPESGGGAAAFNSGLERARGRWVLLFNGSTLPASSCVRRHLCIQARQTAPTAVLGAWHLRPDAEQAPLMQVLEERDVVFPHPALQAGRRYGWRAFTSGNVSVMREHLDAVQGFDASFGEARAADADLGLRLEQVVGLSVLYAPQAMAWHDHELELQDLLASQRLWGRALVALWRKHGTPRLLTPFGFSMWVDERFWRLGRETAVRERSRRSGRLAVLTSAMAAPLPRRWQTWERVGALDRLAMMLRDCLGREVCLGIQEAYEESLGA